MQCPWVSLVCVAQTGLHEMWPTDTACWLAKISALKMQIFRIFDPKTPHFSRKICSVDPTFGNPCGTHPPKKKKLSAPPPPGCYLVTGAGTTGQWLHRMLYSTGYQQPWDLCRNLATRYLVGNCMVTDGQRLGTHSHCVGIKVSQIHSFVAFH